MMTMAMRTTVGAGLVALWITLSLVAAVLVTPAETMAMFDRKGAWGVPGAVRDGSRILVNAVVGTGKAGRS